ncbi:hypothetical protein Q2T42_25665 [Leptolyngbya boryana CZ1]|uniref:Uncharacterized protein n=1 Tax=Leptolyngbya boryana CZ1 TaxID=3060204 RepID=A0AA96WVV5_LEPBY|nr:hypothetical protein [Leptolyngbya boryana]WNZ45179.1 hypothetical protein Q2T42_25665 [Leptolyngbya boryana CZ1]
MARPKRGDYENYLNINICLTPKEHDAIVAKMPPGTPKSTFAREVVFKALGIDSKAINQPSQAA